MRPAVCLPHPLPSCPGTAPARQPHVTTLPLAPPPAKVCNHHISRSVLCKEAFQVMINVIILINSVIFAKEIR